MSDRELLELAAKAAGYQVEFKRWSGMARTGMLTWSGTWTSGERSFVGALEWNALTDDGDALRLAVKLGIALDNTCNRCWTFAAGMAIQGVCEEFYKDDPYAATRRAIVRAASEIGEAMP